MFERVLISHSTSTLCVRRAHSDRTYFLTDQPALACLMDKGIIIGVEHEAATRLSLPFVLFRHSTSVSNNASLHIYCLLIIAFHSPTCFSITYFAFILKRMKYERLSSSLLTMRASSISRTRSRSSSTLWSNLRRTWMIQAPKTMMMVMKLLIKALFPLWLSSWITSMLRWTSSWDALARPRLPDGNDCSTSSGTQNLCSR